MPDIRQFNPMQSRGWKMYEWIVFVLAVSLVLYLIFAGADFGAGILEMFSNREERNSVEALTYQAIGPVWEANHIWLILVIVILFNCFPEVYSLISTYLHIPIMLMLIGIVFRGTAFAFRHYDAIKDRSQRIYARTFAAASFLTPLFLGTVAGATILGRITLNPGSFPEGFLWPWLNMFSISVGLLTVAICAFLAATFLIGESSDTPALQEKFIRQSAISLGITVLMGAVVFAAGEWQGISLLTMFLAQPLSLFGIGFATAGLLLYWHLLLNQHWQAIRLVAAAQAGLILLSWLIAQYPVAIQLHNASPITFHGSQAPEQVLTVIGYTLIFGVLMIFPALIYLIKTFKFREE